MRTNNNVTLTSKVRHKNIVTGKAVSRSNMWSELADRLFYSVFNPNIAYTVIVLDQTCMYL